jgi:hypothetical protein
MPSKKAKQKLLMNIAGKTTHTSNRLISEALSQNRKFTFLVCIFLYETFMINILFMQQNPRIHLLNFKYYEPHFNSKNSVNLYTASISGTTML